MSWREAYGAFTGLILVGAAGAALGAVGVCWVALAFLR